jgi:hypothetical protein
MSSSSLIFGNRPLDRTVKLVADFLYRHLNDPDLEVEAKFGLIVDKSSRTRLSLPVQNEAVLVAETMNIAFESKMSVEMHRHFNKLLNDRVATSNGKVRYRHTKEVDDSYESGRDRVRQTKDGEKVVRTIRKERLADLHIHMPHSHLDCRLSINVERPTELTPSHIKTFTRLKDRLSYTFDFVQLDLTQVKSSDGQTTHELEAEIDCHKLMAERVKCEAQQANVYVDMIQDYIDTIRSVCQKVAL